MFFSDVAEVARHELALVWRHPKMLLAVLVVALLPSVYAAIYLTSVWDPVSHTRSLRVAVANLDEGVEHKRQAFNVGTELVSRLERTERFGFTNYRSAGDAREDVRLGKAAFALIIPKDFSSNAIPGAAPGAGKLEIFVSEGNNYQTSMLARQFATELGHEVNESINERRWALVLTNAAGSQRSVDDLREGVHNLHKGAQQLSGGVAEAAAAARTLHTGSVSLLGGTSQFTDGFQQLGNGLRTLDAKRPRGSELDRLKNGAEALAAGHGELGRGLDELQTGSRSVLDGIAAFKAEADDSLLLPARVKEGVAELAGGMAQLNDGLTDAALGQKKLSEGANQLSEGVGNLTTGVRAMNVAIRQAVNKLPEDKQLHALDDGSKELAHGADTLADGMHKLKGGSQELAGGLQVLSDVLPDTVDKPDGSPQGLAHSVEPVVMTEASVGNSGSGLAPNIIPAALWLGAGVAAFLVHIRVMPRNAKRFSRPAKLLGKISVPVLVVVLQALALGATVQWGLHAHIANPQALAWCLGVSGLSFLMMVILLTRAMGDAGKVISMVFLSVQLSASGGMLPVELSGGLYETLSPWLPMTWVVRAIKAAMFGAYGGDWQAPLMMVAAGGVACLLLAAWIGRWRYLPSSQIQPAVGL
ncbi:YhgE/Pip domain-containing protein [Rhodoferax sp. OV413]|uniref:YhgE/Pip domain-containing protein n=1 Tax=Rhodoferax sp. OV413 TaxID=1855285 RepID=UPI0025DF2553|nr:YhgE/Pip domain-containing protein [Rhodoferax sp. OV413]